MEKIYQEKDHTLLQKIDGGDEFSFSSLYRKYWKKVYTSAFKHLRNHDQAQDITQEVFEAIWQRRGNLHIDNVPAYLHIAVRNRVLNLFEKEKRYVPFEEILHDSMGSQSDHADAAALSNEFIAAYKALVDSLPEQRRKIFRYHFDEGFSTDKIAGQLAISRKTVQNQLGRAVTYLRANLSHLFLFILLFAFN